MQVYQQKLNILKTNSKVSSTMIRQIQLLINLVEKKKNKKMVKLGLLFESASQNKFYQQFKHLSSEQQLTIIKQKIIVGEAIDSLFDSSKEIPKFSEIYCQCMELNSLIPLWKKRKIILKHKIDQRELKIQIYKARDNVLQQTINLLLVEISKKCQNVDGKYIFRIFYKNNKILLFSLPNCDITILHFKICEAKQKILCLKNYDRHYSSKIQYHLMQKQVEQFHSISEDQDETKQFKQERQEQTQIKQINRSIKIELTADEMDELQKQDDYIILNNFHQGRMMIKNKDCKIKTYLFISDVKDINMLIQKYLRMQKWNQNIKQFKLHARISQSIYIIRIKFAKSSLLSLPRYTYALLNTYYNAQIFYINLKSLKKNKNPALVDHIWMDFHQITQIKRCGDNEQQYLMTIVNWMNFKGYYSELENKKIIINFNNSLKKIANYLNTPEQLNAPFYYFTHKSEISNHKQFNDKND